MDPSIYLPDNVQMDKMNNFKLLEKKYRFYENRKTDFSGVIDLNDPVAAEKNGFTRIPIPGSELVAYKLSFPSGVYVIKNALTIQKQLEVAVECMNTYVQRPYRTNLFIYEDNPDWKTTYNPDAKSTEKPEESSVPEMDKSFESTSSKSSTKGASYAQDKFTVNDYKRFNFNKKVRWSNVGAQYDWDKREYPSFVTPMPKIIHELCDLARNMLIKEFPNIDKYIPQAVIVNYYDKKNYMSGHLDDGESDQKSPIFSFAFGSSCVFLMGDTHKDFKPLPIRLDSGDLMVMGGYSRNCYHGVPRILPDSFPKAEFEEYVRDTYPHLYDPEKIAENKHLKDFQNNYRHAINYLCESRINLNFRQVLENKGIEEEVAKEGAAGENTAIEEELKEEENKLIEP